MEWIINSDSPIYKQIIEQIEFKIITGAYPPGSRLKSVRELASEAEINPNTMQKALTELERMGLVYSQRTSGRFITEDKSMIKEKKEKLAIQEIKSFISKMKGLGYTKEEVLALLKKLGSEDQDAPHTSL